MNKELLGVNVPFVITFALAVPFGNTNVALYKPLEIMQGTVTLDIIPNDYCTFLIEYGYRQANIPCFTGHGGTASPSGWVNGPTTQEV